MESSELLNLCKLIAVVILRNQDIVVIGCFVEEAVEAIRLEASSPAFKSVSRVILKKENLSSSIPIVFDSCQINEIILSFGAKTE